MIPSDKLSPMQQKLRASFPNFKSDSEEEKDFFGEYAPNLLNSAYQDVTTILGAICKERITLSDISITYDELEYCAGVKYIQAWLDYLNHFANINKPLVETLGVATMIFTNYRHLNLADLKLIFEAIMRGDYGSFYGSVDAQRIIIAFKEYNTERTHKTVWVMNKRNEYMQPLFDEMKKECINRIKPLHLDDKGNVKDKKLYTQQVNKEIEKGMPKLYAIEAEFVKNLGK